MNDNNINSTINSNSEQIDLLPQNKNKIFQDKNKFCFGIDAVLLSDFAKIKENENAIDLCSGNGIIPLLMVSKTKTAIFSTLEIQQECVNLAKKSIEINNLENRINVFCCDLKNAFSIFKKNIFDVVTCNPPYIKAAEEIKKDEFTVNAKQIARHEILCNLEDVVKCASNLLKSNGRFYLIHKPFRLNEIFIILSKYNLEPKKMRLIYPYSSSKEPTMVLIEAIKCALPHLTIQNPLIIYDSIGKYTKEVELIYNK